MGYLGLRVTLRTPSESEKSAYKAAFGILAALSVFLIVWQGRRNSGTQGALSENVRKARETAESLKEDLKSEVARREQAEKDIQLMIAGKIADATRTINGNIDKAKPPSPIPASLAFSFPVRRSADVPITTAHLRLENGNVHVLFTVKNVSPTAAKNPELWLRICDTCKFAKEPDGFENISGVGFNPKIRHRALQTILNSEVFLPMMGVDVIPPLPSSGFDIGFQYACENCGKTNWRIFKVLFNH